MGFDKWAEELIIQDILMKAVQEAKIKIKIFTDLAILQNTLARIYWFFRKNDIYDPL